MNGSLKERFQKLAYYESFVIVYQELLKQDLTLSVLSQCANKPITPLLPQVSICADTFFLNYLLSEQSDDLSLILFYKSMIL